MRAGKGQKPSKNVTSGTVPRGRLPPDHKGAPEGELEVNAAEGSGALDGMETLSTTLRDRNILSTTLR